MATLSEVQKLAFELSESERGMLAARLLESLPPDFDDDEGYAEAARRAAELDANPEIAISLEELDRHVRGRLG